jgi:hypothetical protein
VRAPNGNGKAKGERVKYIWQFALFLGGSDERVSADHTDEKKPICVCVCLHIFTVIK